MQYRNFYGQDYGNHIYVRNPISENLQNDWNFEKDYWKETEKKNNQKTSMMDCVLKSLETPCHDN